MKPLNTTMFPNQQWTFQRDSAPAHKARTTQEWLRANVPDFISTSDWPSSSPNLNPLDYKLRSELQTMACKKRHPNVDFLKRGLVQAAATSPSTRFVMPLTSGPPDSGPVSRLKVDILKTDWCSSCSTLPCIILQKDINISSTLCLCFISKSRTVFMK